MIAIVEATMCQGILTLSHIWPFPKPCIKNSRSYADRAVKEF